MANLSTTYRVSPYRDDLTIACYSDLFPILLSLPSFRFAAASRITRAHAAIPSGSSAVARSISAFCSSVTGTRRCVRMRASPYFRGRGMCVS